MKNAGNEKAPGRIDLQRYRKKLAIVVPYRDRADHLRQFVPHMLAYFSRDKLDSQISFSIHIIEQASPVKFNRGKLKNVGFDLVRRQSDYVCFHDVDYLPIWADYSWSDSPARLIWHGLTLRENYDRFFGGVVLFDNDVFSKVNGYPNCYWGWGPEDLELGIRCGLLGYEIEKRDGTYQSLPHKHLGFERPGVHTKEAQETGRVFSERKEKLADFIQSDGLSDLSYSMLNRENIQINGKRVGNCFHYKVAID